MKLKIKIRRWLHSLHELVGNLKCRHWWQEDLIFGSPPNTHHIKKRCIKCGCSETVWSGTRREWHEKIGWISNDKMRRAETNVTEEKE